MSHQEQAMGTSEAAAQLGVSVAVGQAWRERGLLISAGNDRVTRESVKNVRRVRAELEALFGTDSLAGASAAHTLGF